MDDASMDVPLDPAMLMAETQQMSMQMGMGMPMSIGQMGIMPDHHEQLQQLQQHPDAANTHPHALDHAHAHPHHQQQQDHLLQHPHSQQTNSLDPSHDAHTFVQEAAATDHDLTSQSQPNATDGQVPPTTASPSAEPPTATKNESPTKTPDDSDDKEYALPLLRQLALELGKDRPKNGDLSKESRIAIVAAVAAGQSKNAVAEAFGISPSTVRRALERWQTRHSNASRPKPGRKPKLTQEAELLLVQAAQAQPGASLKELGAQYGVCYATAKTVLKKHRAGRYSDLPPDPPPEATGAP